MRPLLIQLLAMMMSLPGLVVMDGRAKAVGNLYMLGVAMDQKGEKGGWTRIGEAGSWKLTRAGAILKNQFYTAEADGVLRTTDLATGKRKQVAKADFGNSAIMLVAADKLYTVQNNGNLCRVDPANGNWVHVGAEGAWKLLRAGAVFNNQLYTAESDGSLRSADLTTGERKQIGKLEFGNTAAMYAAADKLYTIETDGNLFRVDPGDGTWARVGSEGAYKLVRAGAIFNDRLYTTESDGTLRCTKLATGEKKLIGNPDFGTTAFMCAGVDEVYTLEADGSLYQIFVTLPESVHEFDWCPEAIEAVFRDQGKAFHGSFHSQMILGNKATHAGVMDSLAWLGQNAAKGDLAVLYIGCHGFADPNEGWGVAATDGKVLWGHEIKAELGKLPCPVLVILSTCESGGFAQVHKNDPPAPANVMALCGCAEKQTTDNQIDISVAEALYGRADYNNDGVVDIDELIRYIQERYKGWWPEPKKGDGSQTPVFLRSAALPGSTPLTKVDPDIAAVFYEGELRTVLVEKQEGDNYQIQIMGWNPKPGLYYLTNTVHRNYICLASDGPPLLVEKEGQWYPARLLSQDGDKYKIHYLSYEADHDQVVTKDRIRYPYATKLPPPKPSVSPHAPPPPKPPTAAVKSAANAAPKTPMTPTASTLSPNDARLPEPAAADAPTEESGPPSGPISEPLPDVGAKKSERGGMEFWGAIALFAAGPLLLGLGLLVATRRRAPRTIRPPAATKQRCLHCHRVMKIASAHTGAKFRCPGRCKGSARESCCLVCAHGLWRLAGRIGRRLRNQAWHP